MLNGFQIILKRVGVVGQSLIVQFRIVIFSIISSFFVIGQKCQDSAQIYPILSVTSAASIRLSRNVFGLHLKSKKLTRAIFSARSVIRINRGLLVSFAIRAVEIWKSG